MAFKCIRGLSHSCMVIYRVLCRMLLQEDLNILVFIDQSEHSRAVAVCWLSLWLQRRRPQRHSSPSPHTHGCRNLVRPSTRCRLVTTVHSPVVWAHRPSRAARHVASSTAQCMQDAYVHTKRTRAEDGSKDRGSCGRLRSHVCCRPLSLLCCAVLCASEEFHAHTGNINCVHIGRKTSSVYATGGEDNMPRRQCCPCCVCVSAVLTVLCSPFFRLQRMIKL
jgi:hypothetical protein